MRLFKSLARTKKPRKPVERMLQVSGRSLPLKIAEHSQAKRMTLRISAGGRGVRVTVPPGVAMKEAEKFLDRHLGWLESRLEKYPDQPQVRPGSYISLRGVPHLIHHEEGKRGTVMTARTEHGPAIHIFGGIEHLPRRLSDFLKREAKRDIEPLVAKYCAMVDRKAKSISFKDTSSRWGSCTSDGKLSFSWRIVMAPPEVIDYLVAHEVSHLREMNHGPDFWKLCYELCPQTERCKSWLKHNGTGLLAFRFDRN